VVAGNRVYVGSFDKRLYVLDLSNGSQLASFDLGSEIAATPAVADGCLVIGTTDGVVYCLGAKQ
jgi:outer membrane protein assembly factor BamB